MTALTNTKVAKQPTEMYTFDWLSANGGVPFDWLSANRRMPLSAARNEGPLHLIHSMVENTENT